MCIDRIDGLFLLSKISKAFMEKNLCLVIVCVLKISLLVYVFVVLKMSVQLEYVKSNRVDRLFPFPFF